MGICRETWMKENIGEDGTMYITISMLADELDKEKILNATIKKHDKICTIRIRMDSEPMKSEILYLTDRKEEGVVFCQTARGSSFLVKEEMFLLLNQMFAVFDRYRKWQDRLSQAIEQGCTLTELLDLSYPVIQHPLVILDANEWEIAHSDHSQTKEFDQDWTDVLNRHTSDAGKIALFNQTYYKYFSLKNVYRIPGKIFGPGYAFNLIHNKSLFGLILMAEPEYQDKISQGEIDALQYLGELICGMIGINSYNLDTHFPDKPLQEYLVNKDAESFERLERSLDIISWEKTDPKMVIYAEPLEGGSLAPVPSRSKLMFNRMQGIVTVEYKTGLVFLCNLKILLDVKSADKMLSEYLRQISYYAGASREFCNLADVWQMLEQSLISFQNSLQIGGYVNAFEHAILPYIFSLFKKRDAELLKHPGLDILKEYDQRYGSRLYDTLYMFLKNERKISKTILDADIPRSTLLNRLQRIEELLHADLDIPEVRWHIFLSYLMEKYTNPIG